MTKKNVIVVGSSGYLGENIIRFLSDQNFNVIGIQRSNASFKHKNFRSIVGDIKDDKLIESVIQIGADVIIYLAAKNHIESENSLNETISNDVIPFETLCKKISNTKLVIYFSTFQVYGITNEKSIVSEDSQIFGISNYAIAHQVCEKILLRFGLKNKKRIIIFRLTNAVGELHDYTKSASQLVGNDFARQLARNQKIIMKSDGSPVRNFIGISDVINAIKFALKNDNVDGIYNLAGFNTKPIAWLACQYVKKYQEMTNIKAEIFDNTGTKISDDFQTIETYKVSIEKIMNKGITIKNNIMFDIEKSINSCLGKK